MHPIPGLARNLDPKIPKQVLAARVKVIDKRRAEIEALLAKDSASEYQTQELGSELAELLNMRLQVEETLNPKPKPRRSPQEAHLAYEQRCRDIAFLKMQIKSETELTLHAAEKAELAGDHRSARQHRLQIPEIPLRVALEFNKNPALLAEIED